MTNYRRVVVLGVMLTALALTAPADAQVRRDRDRGRIDGGVAYDNGYRDGENRGERDARGNRDFDYRAARDYRRGDRGYDRRYGDRDAYKRLYRSGFATGYADGYRRGGPYRTDRDVLRGGPGARRDRPAYGRSTPGYRQVPGRRTDRLAYDRGMRDGLEKGVEDARDRDRYNPTRHRWYRQANRGYRRPFGSRDRYRDAYREGFLAGYERGYRDGWRDRGPRRGLGIFWPF